MISELEVELGAVAGSSTDRLPKFTAGAGLRRTFLTGRCRGLTLGGNVTHVGEVVQNYARADRRRLDYPAYTLVGLNASRTWKAGAGKITHTVSLSVANVLDEDLLEKSPASEQNAA